jgi:type II secretory pathway predicted ATPase ExeA
MAAESTPNDAGTPGGFLATAVTEDALQRLERGLGVRKPLLLVTGEPGTGKSTLAREAIRRWRQRVTPAWLTARGLEQGALAGSVLASFGGKPKPGASPIALQDRLIEALANATAGGRVAVLVVDDAHELPDDSVVELARLADRAAQRQCPLEVMLVGEPALAARFEAPDLAGASDDVSVRAAVAALSAQDTRHHLLQRSRSEAGAIPAQFSRKACRDIHAFTHGVLRDVEAVAVEAARAAGESGSTTVSPDHVRAAWKAIRRGRAGKAAAAADEPAAIAPEPADEAADSAEKSATAARSHVTTRAEKPALAVTKEQRAADAEPPASKAAKPGHVTTGDSPAPEPAKAEPEEPATFRPSSDPRVKDWVSRFGGSGVSIGGQYAARGTRDLADFAETPRGPQVARSETATGGGASSAGGGAGGGSDDAASWSPLRLEPGRHKGAPRRRDPAFPWQVATAVMGLALVAVLIGQRRMGAPAKQAGPATAPAPAAPPAPAPAAAAARVAATPVTKPAADPKPSAAREASDTRAGSRPRRQSKSAATSRPTAARREPVVILKPTEPVPPPTRSPLPTGLAAKPASRPATPAAVATPATPPTTERPAPARDGITRYAVTVATFDDPDRARAEKKHLSRLTRHRVWVSTSKVDDRKVWRLQFGTFRTRDEAAAAAQSLLWQGVLRDAQVAELPE